MLSEEAYQNLSMNCPVCQAVVCRRSRRRSALDFVFSAAGVFPWRCSACETRFYARVTPLRRSFYARCDLCGNLELQRISAEKISGWMSIAGRWLRVPALRCVPCRYKFFSVRPLAPAERITEIEARDIPAKY
jgi:hypothetical protein